MQSKVAVTYELDDLELGVQELADAALQDFTLKKYTCGILFCFSEMDIQGFAALLQERLPFDVIGCTCIANMDEQGGFHESAVTLTVLTSDSCPMQAFVSGPITPDSLSGEVQALFQRGREALGGEATLAVVLPSYNLNIMLDSYTKAFNEFAPNVPVCGGLPSYNAMGDRNLILFNGELHTDRMAALFIRGDIKPLVVIESVTGGSVESKRVVTKAKDNVVYRVGSQTFVEYMQELDLPVANMVKGNATLTFVTNPLLLENVKIGGKGNYSFVRSLHKIDLKDGSGTAIGEIPENATLSVCSLHGSQIRETSRRAMARLAELMNKTPDRRYSTIMAFSCIGRYLIMVPHNSAEVEGLLEKIPAGLTLSGFYTYGEIGPIEGPRGEMVNFAHNESLVLCAF